MVVRFEARANFLLMPQLPQKIEACFKSGQNQLKIIGSLTTITVSILKLVGRVFTIGSQSDHIKRLLLRQIDNTVCHELRLTRRYSYF
jgi:hypothetical protein